MYVVKLPFWTEKIVRYNRVFVITEFVITEFHCILNNYTFFHVIKQNLIRPILVRTHAKQRRYSTKLNLEKDKPELECVFEFTVK